MRAAVGDRLVVTAHHVCDPELDAEILEVHRERFSHRQPGRGRART